MKKLILLLSIFVLFALACTQTGENRKMAITTNSETAKKLYDEAIVAFEDVSLAKFRKLSMSSLKEDPDFFMANYQLAIYYLFFKNETRFKEFAGKAVNCKAKLSDGELLLMEALKRLQENINADVTDIGKKLTEEFPKDINAYYSLIWFQYIIEDYEGQISTIKSALLFAEKPAPLYNQLGYAYMAINKLEDATLALDKYIELSPDNPNAYDSKGDYFMKIKDYNNAYETFMKAYKIDSLWGYKKALNAKALADSLTKI